MSVKRIVSTSFWSDTKVDSEMSAEDKYFFLYLLTNPYTTQLGIYELPLKQAATHLGWSKDNVIILLERFENKYNMIKYSKETGEVAIKNYLRYSIVKGGKPVMDCLEKEKKAVKDKTLLNYISAHLSKNEETLNSTVREFVEKSNKFQEDKRFEENSFEMSCVNKLIASCRELFENAKVPENYDQKEKWCIEIERMRRIDKRTDSEILEALEFAVHDNFWKTNIRSAKKFREKFEQLIIRSREENKNGRAGKLRRYNPNEIYGEYWSEPSSTDQSNMSVLQWDRMGNHNG